MTSRTPTSAQGDAKARRIKPEIPGKKRSLTGAQITGLVLLGIALLAEAAILTIALVPFIPDFFETTIGTITLVLSSLLLLVGVMLAFYGRKEE